MSLKGRKQAFRVTRGIGEGAEMQEYEIELDEGMVVSIASTASSTSKSPNWPCAGTARPASAVPVPPKSTDGLASCA
ncbi:MAG: hypothetical protein CM15mP128_1610 [Methanobacteriota archaeon]|nr:MAG: hypothetical protein CM15mP128_1610 [Euryarchaeota archaeon]